MKRRRLVALAFAPLAWLGCNGILGIDDAFFVPLPDASSLDGTMIGADAAVPGGPGIVRPARPLVRVPVGETRRISVEVVPDPDAGSANRALGLAARAPDANVTAVVTETAAGRFDVQLVAAAGITTAIDGPLVLDAIDADGSVVGSASVRVLVGLPGTSDVTFGTNGKLVLNALAPGPGASSFPIGAIGRRIFVADGFGQIAVVEEDGRILRTLTTVTPADVDETCPVEALVTAGDKVVVAGTCDFSGAYSVEIAQGADAGMVPPDLAPGETTLAGLAYQVLPFIVYRKGMVSTLSSDAGVATALATFVPRSLFAVDGGVVAVGTKRIAQGMQLGVERFAVSGAGAPLPPPTKFTVDDREASPGVGDTSGTAVRDDVLAIAWVNAHPRADVVQVFMFTADGTVRGRYAFDAVSAQVAVDHRGRVLVAADDAVELNSPCAA